MSSHPVSLINSFQPSLGQFGSQTLPNGGVRKGKGRKGLVNNSTPTQIHEYLQVYRTHFKHEATCPHCTFTQNFIHDSHLLDIRVFPHHQTLPSSSRSHPAHLGPLGRVWEPNYLWDRWCKCGTGWKATPLESLAMHKHLKMNGVNNHGMQSSLCRFLCRFLCIYLSFPIHSKQSSLSLLVSGLFRAHNT